MKKTQRTENPYKNTDTNKRYFTYDYYLRKKYGKKLARIPLDMGIFVLGHCINSLCDLANGNRLCGIFKFVKLFK